ncbi:hypothetical protein AB0J83_31275 [Actinoplanes sp. NPDC049596]|uniref:hypothetical protein n=1 Tax=unclassified Actinoplanes TaxID=2626549 RepID=UPI003425224E
MEPTSSPDNARTNRGLARFWPVHREGEDEATAAEPAEPAATLSSETEMVALGSRRAPEMPGSPVASADTPTPRDQPAGDAKPPLSSPAGSGSAPIPSARPEPSLPAAPPPLPVPGGQHGLPDRDSDHSEAGEHEETGAPAVESARANPWEPDPASFGGFGLGGRNGRMLFGGRNPLEPRPAGLNGHSHGEANGRAATVDGPEKADRNDENGRDDMNGRIPTTGDNGPAPVSGPAGATGDTPEQRRQATGWASVPTSKHPTVSPTSGAPTPGAPTSGAPVSPSPISPSPVSPSPVSPGLGFGGNYGEPASYTPALPDPAAGPVSGVPAPRAASASIPVPAAPPAPKSPVTFSNDLGAPPARTTPATDEPEPLPRRSASLEDAEPARRGRRAAPEEPEEEKAEDAPLRPGDVAEGHIAFWDEDAVRHFRAAWHEVKAEFVDDPEAALTRAHDLLTDAVNELTEALLAERDELDPLRGNKSPDTESMRMAMRGYREFLDRIMAL